MRLTGRPVSGPGFTVRRSTAGVAEVRAVDDVGLARGLGFAHAHDRQVQMMLVRLIGQGRLSECLRADDEALAVDTFMRQIGFARGLSDEIEALGDAAHALALAYAEGVNRYLAMHGRPLEFVAVGYQPEPWAVGDTLLTIRVMSYIGLAQAQADLEKFIIQAIRGGVDLGRLKALFRPHLDAVDDDLVEHLQQLQHVDGLLADSVRFAAGLPRIVASNNWAVASTRSRSGSALQCNDPHLEVNRLPAVWYEWIGHTASDYRMGVSMPGVPGLIMGRTRRVSVGFTYGFMDQVDFFVEQIERGRARTPGGWTDVRERSEIIARRNADSVELKVRETDCGTIECDPRRPLGDGLYLSRAFSGLDGGAAHSLDALVALLAARDVGEAMVAVRAVGISANWLLADLHGDIAYQQSGRLPCRSHSGLHPLLAWHSDARWDGFVAPERLVHERNPESGVLVTANEDRNRPGFPAAINMAMAPYRADRIHELLAQDGKLDVQDMKRIQSDLFSVQAERFLRQWIPLFPTSAAAHTLRAWDRRYDTGSRGAVAFERVYTAVLREVFGRRMFGLAAWDRLVDTTPIVHDYYDAFDTILLGHDRSWFGDEGKDALLRRVLEDSLAAPIEGTWGDLRQIRMNHVLLGGKLPRFLGLDYGPLALPGGRATIVQGGLFESHGRTTTFAPSWRYITDLGADVIHTALPGGPSGRRTSPYYTNDLERWIEFRYKRLSVGDAS